MSSIPKANVAKLPILTLALVMAFGAAAGSYIAKQCGVKEAAPIHDGVDTGIAGALALAADRRFRKKMGQTP